MYLGPEERAAALSLSRGLFAARDAWATGERDAERLREIVRDRVAAEPLVQLEYVSVADAITLGEATAVDRPVRWCRLPPESAEPASSTTSCWGSASRADRAMH